MAHAKHNAHIEVVSAMNQLAGGLKRTDKPFLVDLKRVQLIGKLSQAAGTIGGRDRRRR